MLSMTTVSKLASGTNIPFTAVAPNTLRLQTIKGTQSPQTIYDELTLTDIVPDSVDRMLHYKHGDPLSYEWKITANNAADFGVNWLEFQNHLNESMPSDVSTLVRLVHPAPPSGFNPVATGIDRMSNALRDAGFSGTWANDFQLHEVDISIDYYFWHDVLEGLRSVRIQADIRGEARVVPEPTTSMSLALGMIIVGPIAAKRGGRWRRR